jgi:alkylated DNA nucleotide flippase Atl1
VTLADDVGAVVRLVPPGRVVAYGDLAELFGTSPRIIGRIMATNDAPGLPWWRVLRADGGMTPHLRDEARQHWLEEGIGLAGERARIREFRADLALLADRAEQLLGSLPGAGEPAPDLPPAPSER